MSLLEIIQFPHPILKAETAPLEGVNAAVERLVRDMIETMYHAPGSGLAANQVGVSKQLLVMDVTSAKEEPQAIVIVNPRIIQLSEDTVRANEGCLSVPDYTAEVERSVSLMVVGKDLSGEDLEIEADGWLARVIQHEVDHLNGSLFIDRIGRLKRQVYIRRRKKTLAAKSKD